jgi:hypothetical protein
MSTNCPLRHFELVVPHLDVDVDVEYFRRLFSVPVRSGLTVLNRAASVVVALVVADSLPTRPSLVDQTETSY